MTRALRVDDLGASSKRYAIWSHSRYANATFLKRLPPWKAAGPYREMQPWELDMLLGFVDRFRARVTLAITACWVERDGTLVPYPEKFPRQAEIIKAAVAKGLAEVANHGLTHCREGEHLPRWFHGNREAHREFGEWTGFAGACQRLLRAQSIFQEWLGRMPKILVPPGLQFPVGLGDAAGVASLRVWTREHEARCLTLHDRDLILGDGWRTLRMALARERFATCGRVIG